MGNERENVPQRTRSRRGAVLAPRGLFRGASRLDCRRPSAGSSSVGRTNHRHDRDEGNGPENRPERISTEPNGWPGLSPEPPDPEPLAERCSGPRATGTGTRRPVLPVGPAPGVGARRRSGSGTTAPESSTPAETGSAENTPVSVSDHDSVRSPPGNGSSPPGRSPGPVPPRAFVSRPPDHLSARLPFGEAGFSRLSLGDAGVLDGGLDGGPANPSDGHPDADRPRQIGPSRSEVSVAFRDSFPNSREGVPERARKRARTGRRRRADRSGGPLRQGAGNEACSPQPGRSQSEA